MIKKIYKVRKMTSSDHVFLKEMLYQAIYIPPGEKKPSKSILDDPKLKKYYLNFGNNSDLGYAVMEKSTNMPIGAIWLRLFSEENKGWGFVESSIPEMSMAVDYDHRGKGVGRLLLNYLLDNCIAKYPKISLSVDSKNYAKKLYEKYGFKEIYIDNDSVTMLLELNK